MVRSIVCRAWFATILLMSAGFAHATTTSLYTVDGTLPGTQGSLVFAGFGGSEMLVADGVSFDSTALGNNGQIGYVGVPVVLDRSSGFTLTFDLRIDSESHAGSDNRAGFSVIAIASDLLGIEIGFWEDEIWVQNANFSKGEGTIDTIASFNTTSAIKTYSLSVLGAGYTLFDGNAALFSGPLRDYPGGFPSPYDVANAVFFGDDTTSARATATLGAITVTTAPVPLPAGFGLMLPALLGLFARRRHDDGGQPAIT